MPDRATIIRNATARARNDWANYTLAQEKEILQLFEGTAGELAKSIEKFTVEGKVAPARLKTLLNKVNDEMRLLRPQITGKIKAGMSNSVNYGMKAGMRGMEKVLPDRLKLGVGSSFVGKDGKIRVYDTKVEAYKDSLWAKINSDAMDALLRFQPAGITLSDRVWDVSWQAEKAIRNRLQMGILAGDSPAGLSRDIRGYLTQPETLRGRVRRAYTPGKGVYKSAYKNAMRVTRTEYARAFTEGTYRYGAQKTWIKGYYFRTASGNPCPICSDYSGTFFPKDEPPPIPTHPHCFCYAEIAIDEDKIKAAQVEEPAKEDVYKKMAKAEGKIINDKVEHVLIYDTDGNLLLSKTGTEHGVFIPPEQQRLIKNSIYTHNHPGIGDSFSPKDIMTSMFHDAKEIRAIGVNYKGEGYLYRAIRPKEGWFPGRKYPATGLVRDAAHKKDMVLTRKWKKRIAKGQMTIDEAKFSHWHNIWGDISKEFNFEYTRTRLATGKGVYREARKLKPKGWLAQNRTIKANPEFQRVVNRALSEVDEQVPAFLQGQARLTKIEYRNMKPRKIPIGGGKTKFSDVRGFYNEVEKKITFNTKYYGKEFSDASYENFLRITQQYSRQSGSVVHELGHALDAEFNFSSRTTWKEWFKKGKTGVSEYAKVNLRESFAENFKYYADQSTRHLVDKSAAGFFKELFSRTSREGIVKTVM